MRTWMIGSVAAMAIAVVFCSLVGVTAVGSADARSVQRATRCPAFTGPAWTYTNGSGRNALLFRGTRYGYTVVRISCTAGLRLIRQVIPKTAHAPSPAALLYLKRYGCIPATRWLYGKKMFAGACIEGSATGPSLNASGFSWGPVLDDPTSKRIN